MWLIGRSSTELSTTSEQQDRNSTDLGQPHGDRQLPSGELQLHGERQPLGVLDAGEREAAQVVVRVGVLLVAIGVDGLTEVALAIEQPDADERQRHVAGRLHVVAGEDPEAAGVDAERLVDAVFGAEIGDRTDQLPSVLALEPVAGAVGHVPVEVREHVLVFGEELLVFQES